ncbi:MAG: nicotinate (nicotinamide) nucleotide adenylyltransferase [Nitrospinae bacterium]|nr:nicotinate (nicotinamide) nucleotide adenylyltransferase [Nitrospinota bacterium]
MQAKQESKQQIGILGGTFDPVHLGHLGLARETLERFSLDRILFVPAFQSPHKRRIAPASPVHRLEMLRLALQNDPALELSDVEIRRGELSYTIDTLDFVESQFPGCELNLILGRDNLSSLDLWKDSRRIMERCHILVGSRPGVESSSSEEVVCGLFGGDSPYTVGEPKNSTLQCHHGKMGRRLVIFQISPHDISSGAIRERVAGGESVRNLLLPEVEAYIITHQLYQT